MNIIIYPSHFELMEQLTDEQSGKLIKAIGQYRNGIYPQITDPLVMGIFMSIKRDFDIQAENYRNVCERNQKNGKNGGRPKKPTITEDNPQNPMGYLETQQNPKNLKDKDKDKDKDIDSIQEHSIEATELDRDSKEILKRFDNMFSDI